jgi:hypothetical protein
MHKSSDRIPLLCWLVHWSTNDNNLRYTHRKSYNAAVILYRKALHKFLETQGFMHESSDRPPLHCWLLWFIWNWEIFRITHCRSYNVALLSRKGRAKARVSDRKFITREVVLAITATMKTCQHGIQQIICCTTYLRNICRFKGAKSTFCPMTTLESTSQPLCNILAKLNSGRSRSASSLTSCI